MPSVTTRRGDRENPGRYGGETLAHRARAYLDRHPTERITLDVLAEKVGASPSHLQRTFKRAVGMSPAEYARMKRHQQFKSAMRNGRTVSQATL